MPVINPWLFYLINVLEALKIACMVATFILVFVVMGLLAVDDMKKWKIAAVALLSISIAGLIFIPSKSTSTKMLIANFATYENIELTKDSVIELVDYIVEKVNGGITND